MFITPTQLGPITLMFASLAILITSSSSLILSGILVSLNPDANITAAFTSPLSLASVKTLGTTGAGTETRIKSTLASISFKDE